MKPRCSAAVEYTKTSSYYWPLIGGRKYNYAVLANGDVSSGTEEVTGPFGFGEATRVNDDTVSRRRGCLSIESRSNTSPTCLHFAVCCKGQLQEAWRDLFARPY